MLLLIIRTFEHQNFFQRNENPTFKINLTKKQEHEYSK